MTPVEQHVAELKALHPEAKDIRQPNGAVLIEIPNYPLPPGWNQSRVTVIFLTPPGYPGAQPDCFWMEPAPIRLANGGTPQASNDSNPIPGVGPRGTWFSWHLQSWNPNRDSLVTYVSVIKQRLCPAR
jgi:hypothetical protein